ncbi:MAG TPA: PEP-CTERM sorting domain-containing protein [Candidatus Aquabacterium excrementipullorum]|nr:PEP-CTERM sorting domain-containing protein [Candidatus Aquabacterium excrementipullorum]
MKTASALRTRLTQLLLLGASLLSFSSAHAATDKYIVSALSGYVFYGGDTTSWLQVVSDTQGTSGTFTSTTGHGDIVTPEVSLRYVPIDFTTDGTLSFASAVVTGNDVRQDFTGDASFQMKLYQARPGLSDLLLGGSIVGGSLTGQFGSSSVQITFTVRNLDSGVIALATDTTTLTFSGSLNSTLSSGTFADLTWFNVLNWSVPNSALASAVPEPGTIPMFVLGMAFIALAMRRTTQQRSLALPLTSH